MAICLFIISATALGQSKAHDNSNFAVIDPSYNSQQVYPESPLLEQRAPWIYGSGELEAWRLQLLMKRKDSAQLKVGYPGIYHVPFQQVSYQISLGKAYEIESMTFQTVGKGRMFINGIWIANVKGDKAPQTVKLPREIKVQTIRFALADKNDPPALLIEKGPFATSNDHWQWRTENMDWNDASQFLQNGHGVPPHLLEDPTIRVDPISVKDHLYDFGKQLYGYIYIKSKEKPKMNMGESDTEALDVDNTVLEQTREVIKQEDGLWRSKVPLAFRYVFVEGLSQESVYSEAIFYPASYKGAFACSNERLTKIWMNSAYTLRLNMHDFLLDGMKRDRLPWTGDMAMSMMVNSYTFGDPELVRRSLVALGRAGIDESDINGIVDYSLWWIIAQDQYQLYYDDHEHLAKEWNRIGDALDNLESRTDENGFLKITAADWIFVDWVEQEKWTVLQIMWWWAQKSAAALADRMKDTEAADHWGNSANQLKSSLRQTVWDTKKGIWYSGTAKASDYTRHPNFMAVVSGLTGAGEYKGILKVLENDEVPMVGTPYMAGFEMMARAQMGNIDYTLDKIADYWGGMMDRGATSFWEAYDPSQTGADQYAFYGRPYAKSLCHAWSSGPAAILPSQIVGIKPLADGWKEFAIAPNLGSLQWASVAVPTTYGIITVNMDENKVEVSIPAGTVLVWQGERITGPKLFTTSL